MSRKCEVVKLNRRELGWCLGEVTKLKDSAKLCLDSYLIKNKKLYKKYTCKQCDRTQNRLEWWCKIPKEFIKNQTEYVTKLQICENKLKRAYKRTNKKKKVKV